MGRAALACPGSQAGGSPAGNQATLPVATIHRVLAAWVWVPVVTRQTVLPTSSAINSGAGFVQRKGNRAAVGMAVAVEEAP